MGESFFSHYLDFFLGFIVIMIGSLVAAVCIILYAVTWDSWFLIGVSTTALATLYYGMNFLVKFRDFKEDLYLFFPKNVINTTESVNSYKINEEIDNICNKNGELPIKVCRLTSQGLSLHAIQGKLALSHPQTARRLLEKGLKQLLELLEAKTE